MNKDTKPTTACLTCEAPAKWVRMTQFSGEHHYCTKCAKLEEDFGKEDPSYFFWRKV